MKFIIITSATLSLFFNWHSQSKASPFSQESEETKNTELTPPTPNKTEYEPFFDLSNNSRTAQEWKEYFAQPSFTATAHDYKNAGLLFSHDGNFVYAAQCFQNCCALLTKTVEKDYDTVAYFLDKVDGYDGSIESFRPPFKSTVALPASFYYNLGYAYLVGPWENHTKALENFKAYFAQEAHPNPNAYLDAASCYSQARNYRKSLSYAQKYLDVMQQSGSTEIIEPMVYSYFAFASHQLGDSPTAAHYFQKYFELRENSDADSRNEANALFFYAESLMVQKEYTKAIEIYNTYIKKTSENPQPFLYNAYFFLSYSYLENKELKNAQKAFDNYLRILKNLGDKIEENHYILAENLYEALENNNMASKYYKEHLKHFPSMSTLNLKNALLSFILSQDIESANTVLKLLGQRNVIIWQENKLLRTAISAPKQNRSKRSKATSRPPIKKNTVQELKKSISIQNYDNAKKIFDQVKKVQHPDLMDLENEMQEVFEKCTQHFERVTQISSTPSTGPSSSRDTPESSQQADFLALQKLSSRMDELFKSWQKKKDIALRTAYNEEKKRIFLASATAPQELISIPLSMNIRAAFGYKKTSAAPATRNASSSASTSPASSSSSSNPLQASWSFTHQANKQRTVLKTMPGLQTKLERFLDEIEEDPLLQTTAHGSGRAKKLVATDNIFSRRFDKGNRFVYKVEKTTPDNARVTVLSLLGHYKNLDLSK